MNMMIKGLQRFARFRHIHTIISQETIKPSNPTPLHLKTHVLSLVDDFNPHHHMPFVFFYKNYKHGDINNLKNSLSQCLSQYYMFAGRFSNPFVGHIDCNDEGVEFLEASHDIRLDDFIRTKHNDETLRELLPNVDITSPNLLEVQLNHFTGGGAALSVSTSHKVADAFTMFAFIRQWAKFTRGGPPIKPQFISSSTSYNNIQLPDTAYKKINEVKYVSRRFVFPNSKLYNLKNKIISMGVTLTNPPITRVEALISLVFKASVDASTIKLGVFKPPSLFHTVNMRNKIFKNDHEHVAGNIVTLLHEKMNNESDIMMNKVAATLRKLKLQATERDVQQIGEKWGNIFADLGTDPNLQAYYTSSICGFSFYDVDFGWGKPIEVKFVIPDDDNKILLLMDTVNSDGIEATLHLPEEDMVILQEDKELLEYVDA